MRKKGYHLCKAECLVHSKSSAPWSHYYLSLLSYSSHLWGCPVSWTYIWPNWWHGGAAPLGPHVLPTGRNCSAWEESWPVYLQNDFHEATHKAKHYQHSHYHQYQKDVVKSLQISLWKASVVLGWWLYSLTITLERKMQLTGLELWTKNDSPQSVWPEIG